VIVEVVALVVSPGHNYWFHGRPANGVGPHPTSYPSQVQVVAGAGIVGDRFFGADDKQRSPLSFLAAEDVEAVGTLLGIDQPLDARLARRNVVVRGLELKDLRHRRFRLTQGGNVLELQGGRETAPCDWMDHVLAPGARDALRDRGGLRVRPLSTAVLRIGPAHLDVAPP